MGMSAPPITPQVLFDQSVIGQAEKKWPISYATLWI